jgi:ribose transport system substrate-binding protein
MRAKITRLSAGLSIISALAIFLCSCGNYAAGGYRPSAGSGAIPSAIDYGPFTGEEARRILTLHADAASITGKVGLVVSGTFPYGMGTKKMAEETVRRYFPHMTLYVGNGDSDPAVQSTIIEDFITKKVDVLVIDLTEKDAVNPALDRAKAAGIPIILIDRWATTEVHTVIKADDVEVGKKAAETLAKFMNGEGNVLELKGTAASSTTIDRHQGISDTFAQYPGIRVVASMNADFDQYKALTVMEDVLERLPKGKLNGVISHADVMTLGAIQAIRAAGRENEIKVVSVDAQDMALDAIQAGRIDAVVAYPIVMPMGIVAAAKILAGEPLPKFVQLEAPVITKDNVDEYKGKTGY